jgi:hypothetical protein
MAWLRFVRSALPRMDHWAGCYLRSDLCSPGRRPASEAGVAVTASTDARRRRVLRHGYPETLLFTGAHAEEPLGAATPLFLANEFRDDDVNKFTSLANSAQHVATLDGASRGDRTSSLRSRDIMQPLGLGDELRAALMVGQDCWGYLCLHRDDHPLGFTSSEAAMIARLGPHIAHGLRQATLMNISTASSETVSPGVVLLAKDLSLVAISAEAEHLLSLVDAGGSTKLPLPLAV